jgi:hypothetical protein
MPAVPAAIPYTTPVPSTEAIAVLLLLHTPVVELSERIVVDPTHSAAMPPMLPTTGMALINTS